MIQWARACFLNPVRDAKLLWEGSNAASMQSGMTPGRRQLIAQHGGASHASVILYFSDRLLDHFEA
jgi:hypothetical protein